MQRGIVTFNRVTADGYFAAPDGTLEWVVPEPAVDARGAEATPAFDTVLFGRRTYELFEQFWPRAAAEASRGRNPHGSPGAAAIRTMATWLDAARKVVFSRTRLAVNWRNSELVRAFDPRRIEAMKRGPGGNIIVFGSGSIVSLLARHDLIDEYQFVINPSLLGAGQSLIGGCGMHTPLELLEATAYQSGNVLLRYARAGRPAQLREAV